MKLSSEISIYIEGADAVAVFDQFSGATISSIV